MDHALRDYSDAFGRGDVSAIGWHCNVPFLVISSQGGQGFAYNVYYGGIQRGLRERGYSHSRPSELHAKLLDQTRALASGVFVRQPQDGRLGTRNHRRNLCASRGN